MKMMRHSLALSCLVVTQLACADITVPMFATTDQGFGQSVGSVLIQATKDGLLLTPDLHGLSPGPHGFHIHQTPSCADNGMAAGGHFDPQKTAKHRGPFSDQGHLGDLPVLMVNADGSVKTPVLAPRIKDLSTIAHKSLMVHEGGDNYSDTPEKQGGGGGRMDCGIIP